ncbi:MAG: hypothetical protein ACM32E_06750, partial [Gemmatimonadota bacterium]
PAALQQLSWAIFAIVVVVSCIRRVHAWRAWAILAGWIVAADMAPVVLGRLGAIPGILLGTQTRYLEDAAPVLALCAGLAFLPLAQEQDVIKFRLPAARPATVLLLSVCLVGSFWSLQSFQSQNNGDAVAARSYIATARAAVSAAPAGTLILDGPTPVWVMAPQIFGLYSYTSRVIGPIAHGEPAKHLAWTGALRGVASSLMVFNSQGQLLPVELLGPASGPPPAQPPGRSSGKAAGKASRKASGKTSGPRCWGVTTTGTRVPVNGTLYRWSWMVRLDYSGPAASAAVNYGGAWAAVALPAGTHSFYVPVTGGGSVVTVRLATPAPGWCLSGLAVGSLHPAPAGPAIPPVPVSG